MVRDVDVSAVGGGRDELAMLFGAAETALVALVGDLTNHGEFRGHLT